MWLPTSLIILYQDNYITFTVHPGQITSEGGLPAHLLRYLYSWGFEVDAQLVKQEKRTGDVATISTKGYTESQ